MNGNDLLESMNGVDEELLDTVLPTKEKAAGSARRRRIFAAVLAGAVLCGCTAVGAVSIIKGRFGPIPEGTHGYRAEFELTKFPWSEFRGQVSEASEIIPKQYENYTPQPPWSSLYIPPSVYTKGFDTLDEAVKYTGLDALKAVEPPFDLRWVVSAIGDEEGRIESVDVASVSAMIRPGTDDRFGCSMFISILTENSAKSLAFSGADWGDYDPGSITYGEFTTSSGVLCQYASVGVGERERELCDGYVLDNGILYRLSIPHMPGDHDAALEMIKAWAEGF